jgi:hypothetical protein
VAKVTCDLAGRRYFLKYATAGLEGGRMFNHLSPSFDPDSLRRKTRTGQGFYEFRQVNAAAYDAFLRFLRTNNAVHLRHAEREAV